ncbi:MAG TPA: PQQ-binding-like beta-propeller repeat protein [Chitinophaga sp.]
MFRLVGQINDVSNPVVSGMEIFYTDSNQVFIKAGADFKKVENHLSPPFALIGITGDEMIVRTDNKITALDTNNTIKEIYPLLSSGEVQIKLLYEQDLMIVGNNLQQGRRLCKYDFRRSQIFWEREEHYSAHRVFRSGAYLITTYFDNNDLLACFNENNGAVLWQLHINELELPGAGYQIFSQPGIYKDLVLVNIRQQFNLSVIGLDINTGQLRWHLQNTGLRFQVEGDKILCFSGNDILQIDPASGTILHSVSVLDKLTAAGIDPYGNVVFKDQHMYLAGILDTIISVWDINTGALLWQHRLYDKSLTGRRGISIPASENILQVHDHRIYVLDSERVLNVFERI